MLRRGFRERHCRPLSFNLIKAEMPETLNPHGIYKMLPAGVTLLLTQGLSVLIQFEYFLR